MNIHKVAALVVWLMPFYLSVSWADHRFGPQVDSIRCGNDLIQVGDDAYQLLDKCGDPDFRQVIQLNRYSDFNSLSDNGSGLILEDTAYVVTEEWVYKQGRGRLVKVLTVSGGVLVTIRLSDRE